MKTRNKVLLLALCALLLVVTTVFATLAFLTDNDSITNTFTVGKVTITLDEAYLNEDGRTVDNNVARVTGEQENDYHLVPGRTIEKDPKITVDTGSETSYVYAQVVTPADLSFLETDMSKGDAGWVTVSAEKGIYRWFKALDAGDSVNVFTTITVPEDAGNTTIAAANTKQMQIYAFAIQVEGFEQVADADTKAIAAFDDKANW